MTNKQRVFELVTRLPPWKFSVDPHIPIMALVNAEKQRNEEIGPFSWN